MVADVGSLGLVYRIKQERVGFKSVLSMNDWVGVQPLSLSHSLSLSDTHTGKLALSVLKLNSTLS